MTTTSTTTTTCERCGIGPFYVVGARPYPSLCLDCAELVTPSATTVRRAMVNDADHAVLAAAWHQAFDVLRSAGLEADADHPTAAIYRAASNASNASNAVNHANRSRDFAIATGQSTS